MAYVISVHCHLVLDSAPFELSHWCNGFSALKAPPGFFLEKNCSELGKTALHFPPTIDGGIRLEIIGNTRLGRNLKEGRLKKTKKK